MKLLAFRVDTLEKLLEDSSQFAKLQVVKKAVTSAVRRRKMTVITEVAVAEYGHDSSGNNAGKSAQKWITRIIEYAPAEVAAKADWHVDKEEEEEEDEAGGKEKLASKSKSKPKTSADGVIASSKVLQALRELLFERVLEAEGKEKDDDAGARQEEIICVWDGRDIREHLPLEVARSMHSSGSTHGSTTAQTVLAKLFKSTRENEDPRKEILLVDVQKLLASATSGGTGGADLATKEQRLEKMRTIDDVFSSSVRPKLEQQISQGRFRNIEGQIGNLLVKYHGASPECGVDNWEHQQHTEAGNAAPSSAPNFFDDMVTRAAALRDTVRSASSLDLESAAGKLQHMQEGLDFVLEKKGFDFLKQQAWPLPSQFTHAIVNPSIAIRLWALVLKKTWSDVTKRAACTC